MSPDSFPSEQHEYVDVDELARIASENQKLLERKYHDDVAIFRAKLFEKLSRQGALLRGSGWAVFDLSEAEEGSVSTVGPVMHDVLVLCGRITPTGELPISRIRFLTNEIYLAGGDEGDAVEWLTRDVMVDEDADTQYFVDVVNFEKVTADVTTPFGETVSYDFSMAAPFMVTDEGRAFAVAADLPTFPARLGVFEDDENKSIDSVIYPFGNHTCLEDRKYALEVAESIFELIKDLDPVHSSATWTS